MALVLLLSCGGVGFSVAGSLSTKVLDLGFSVGFRVEGLRLFGIKRV